MIGMSKEEMMTEWFYVSIRIDNPNHTIWSFDPEMADDIGLRPGEGWLRKDGFEIVVEAVNPLAAETAAFHSLLELAISLIYGDKVIETNRIN